MRVVLWDTRTLDVSKDFAAGFGVGQFEGRGLRERIIRYFFTRDRRPVALLFPYLASALRQLGHEVRYVEDRVEVDADLFIFSPSLITLQVERRAISQVLQRNPAAHVLVVGSVASLLPEAFAGLRVVLVKGEAEQLLWKLDEVLEKPEAVVQLGLMEDLDRLPLPDWSLFRPRSFRIHYDFWKFPTALIQHSRGCAFKCDYCPYVAQGHGVRYRSPEAVVEEIVHDIENWGFRSFKFRDPLFGADRTRVFRLVQLLERLGRKIQFSIETRVELMRPEVLRALKRVGLTSITVGIESPDEETLRSHGRHAANAEANREFFARCREMGIRTVAGFIIGFPHDTRESIHGVLNYALSLGPTYANFNILTPYLGTEFYDRLRARIANFDFQSYTVYTPVMKYEHLTAEQLQALHAKCFRRYHFRWEYLRDNAHLLWPKLQCLGIGRPKTLAAGVGPAHAGSPHLRNGLEVLRRSQSLRKDESHRQPGSPEDGFRRQACE